MSNRTEPMAAARRIERLVPVFFALGDPTRARLLALLCAGGALSISTLTAETALTRQAVTKHLQVLADAGLARDLKVGRERQWAFEPRQVIEARNALADIGRQWDDALARLKRAVEGGAAVSDPS